ncbi:hypothetical protein BDN70DRAFT_919905 [Pholiota conissans]|uniref:Uncharacterized protein n=1 Tax=Pholiota conissans TaxID=109636 RepID=A0A9P6D2Q1_9AGAR|nr:hypothetical protein BDN70DRAFT_919905 [Pholiota conissans]
MRFSVSLALLGMFMAGSHVLAAPEIFDDYSLDARDVDMEDLNAREVGMDNYMDFTERDLIDMDPEDLFAREYYQELSEREDLEDLLDYVTREDEGSFELEARDDWDELEERDFDDIEDEFVRRADGYDDVELEAREPLRYRIGVVVLNHND